MAFQILSLSGGGFLGLYTIFILNELEKEIGRPIGSCFDLIAGTSIGGIIGLALAAEIPTNKILNSFKEHGEKIFSDRKKPTSTLGRYRDLARSFISSKYDSEGLKKTISEILGKELLMGDLKRATIIPSVNLTKGSPQIFKTPHHKTFIRDLHLRALDVALATSAAPTFFPIAEIGDELFADGGLYANSPDLIALHEAEYFLQRPSDEIKILSIGTTTTKFSVSHEDNKNMGVKDWGSKLAQTIISAQQMDVDYIMKHKLGSRYLRIDQVQSSIQERELALDIANELAQKTIRGLAEGSTREALANQHLRSMLKHVAPDPKYYRNGN